MFDLQTALTREPQNSQPALLDSSAPLVLLPNPTHVAGLRCSAATARALQAADLIRAGGGLVSVPIALTATGANLRYCYLALSLSTAERDFVEAGLMSLVAVDKARRRQEADRVAALAAQ